MDHSLKFNPLTLNELNDYLQLYKNELSIRLNTTDDDVLTSCAKINIGNGINGSIQDRRYFADKVRKKIKESI